MARRSIGRSFVAPVVAVVLAALTLGAACGKDDQAGRAADVADRDVARSGEALSANRAGLSSGSASSGGASLRDEAASVTAGGQSASTDASGGGGGAGPAGAGSPTGNALPQSVSQPKVVRTATLRVEVDEGAFQRAFSRVATIASTLGGFVASSTSAAGDGDAGAAGSLVVRVPADRFDDARRQLQALGTLESEQLNGEDVSGQLTDLDARLRNLRAQEEAIRALMARAKDVGETLAVQIQLGAVREQIEQLAAQQARLADAAAMSTLTVEVFEPGAAARGKERSALAKAFASAVDGAQDVLAGTIVALGYLVPLALLLAVAFVAGRALLGLWGRGPRGAATAEAEPAASAG